ncbi:hypothetical protein EDD86DRAFT_131704 [Gorgonomyces haynaldii]|nr:hypothetical protein EDD86DRAFT_131704 [Gorgonomyces haynaldii]
MYSADRHLVFNNTLAFGSSMRDCSRMWMVHERTLRRWKRMQQTQFRNEADDDCWLSSITDFYSIWLRRKLQRLTLAVSSSGVVSYLVCTVVDVDEHRTSKLHLDCHFRMQNMISWKMAKWKERHICLRRGTPVTEHAHRQCTALPERAGALLPL